MDTISSQNPLPEYQHLQQQLKFEQLISGISARFINLPAHEIETAICESLRQVGELVNVESVSFYELTQKSPSGWNTFEWHAPQLAQSQPTFLHPLKVHAEDLLHHGPLVISDVSMIPADWHAGLESSAATGLKTGIVTPIYLNGQFYGIIMISSVLEKRDWPPELAGRIEFIGEIFANALFRQQSEERIRFQAGLLNAVGEAVIATTPEGEVTYWNPAAEQLYGWSADEALGQDIVKVTPANTTVLQATRIMEHMKTGQAWLGEFLVQNRAGEEFPALVTNTPVLDDNGQLVSIIGLSQNISAQKRTEQKLQYRIAFDALVSEISTDLILLEADQIDAGIELALEKIAKFVNAEAGYVFLFAPDKQSYWLEYLWQTDGGVMDKARLHDLDINDLPYFNQRRLQKLPLVVSSIDDLPPEASAERQLYEETGYQSALEVPMLWQDDVIGFVGLTGLNEPHPWNNDDIQLLTIVGQMITNALKRKVAEKKLRQELEFHEAIIQNAASGLCVFHTTADYPYLEFTEWNRKMVEITGYSLAKINRLGWYQTLYVDPIERERAKTRLSATSLRNNIRAEERTITRIDGQERLVSIFTTNFRSADGTLHTLALMQDITEQHRLAREKEELEAQLRRSQRLDTVGTLAGGIAHDFNNLLMPIIGFAELAELRLPADHTVIQYLHRITDAANQAKDLIQQILTFSRQVEKEHHPIQLAPIIKESLKLLRATLPTTIQIEQNIAPNCPSVMGDPAQIHQVIMNLCANGFQAMQQSGGILTVSLEQFDSGNAGDYPQLQLAAQPYLKLTVRDTGTGMDDYTRDRVFEPFFTTHKIGQASGLGLSIVHGIVKNHKGEVLIHSTPDQGTEVTVFLPAVQAQPQASGAHTHTLYSGSGTILLVDDNATIVEVTTEMLTQFGYTVLAFTDSVEALKAFVDNANDIDLVITDQVMPNLNGIELAEKISQICPDVPLVLTTGYSEIIEKTLPEHLKIVTVLKKPIGFAALGKTMADILAK